MFGWSNKGPSPAQKLIGSVLFNDALHVLSSFELNRIASLTYGDEVCEEIFELLEQIQARPMEHSVLTVQKSLVVTKHAMVYGSEKCVNSALCLQRGVETLLEFNTVLWAQKLQGASAVMYRLKGGGVDKGFPVREAAKEVWPLMQDVNKLRALRNNSADPNSLVPVGSDKIAFLSDDVRHFMLKKRIQEQYKLQTKSNLVKEEGGFGSGYASKDGKMVVGAAHGLDEMIKQADIANRKFSDQGQIGRYEMPNLTDLAAMSGQTANANTDISTNTDLLSSGSNPQPTAAVGDLLDFSAEPVHPQTTNAFEGDLLGTGGSHTTGGTDLLGTTTAGTVDLLGTASATNNSETINILLDPSAANATQTPMNSLLDLGSTAMAPAPAIDPMALYSATESAADSTKDTQTNGLMIVSSDLFNALAPTKQPKTSVMGGSIMDATEDRFAALDSLGVPAARNSSTFLTAKEAENRLLSQSTGSFDMSTGNRPSSASLEQSMAQPVSVPAVFTSIPEIGISANSSSMMSTGMNLSDGGLTSQMQDMQLGANPVEFPVSSTAGSGLKVAQTVSSLHVSATFGDVVVGDDDDGGFVMGGTMGSGLEPTASAPAAPPPPPPPPM